MTYTEWKKKKAEDNEADINADNTAVKKTSPKLKR